MASLFPLHLHSLPASCWLPLASGNSWRKFIQVPVSLLSDSTLAFQHPDMSSACTPRSAVSSLIPRCAPLCNQELYYTVLYSYSAFLTTDKKTPRCCCKGLASYVSLHSQTCTTPTKVPRPATNRSVWCTEPPVAAQYSLTSAAARAPAPAPSLSANASGPRALSRPLDPPPPRRRQAPEKCAVMSSSEPEPKTADKATVRAPPPPPSRRPLESQALTRPPLPRLRKAQTQTSRPPSRISSTLCPTSLPASPPRSLPRVRPPPHVVRGGEARADLRLLPVDEMSRRLDSLETQLAESKGSDGSSSKTQ